MCLAQGHNTVTQVRLEPEAPQSRAKHSTTEPLCSLAPVMAPDKTCIWKFKILISSRKFNSSPDRYVSMGAYLRHLHIRGQKYFNIALVLQDE